MISEILKKKDLFKQEEKKEEKRTLPEEVAKVIDEFVERIVVGLRLQYVDKDEAALEDAEDYVISLFEKYEEEYFSLTDEEFGDKISYKLLDTIMGDVIEDLERLAECVEKK